jgi:hypothetical protein
LPCVPLWMVIQRVDRWWVAATSEIWRRWLQSNDKRRQSRNERISKAELAATSSNSSDELRKNIRPNLRWI